MHMSSGTWTDNFLSLIHQFLNITTYITALETSLMTMQLLMNIVEI